MPITPEIVGKKSDGVFYASGARAPVVNITELDGLKLPHPLETKILLPGPKGSLLEYHLSKGEIIPPHRFAHDFINCIVRGNMKVTLAGRIYEAERYDAWSGAAGVEVSLEALDDTVLLEWMGPPHLITGSRLITWGAGHPCDSHLFTKFKEVEGWLLGRVEGETEFGPPGVDIQHRLRVLISGPNATLFYNTHARQKWALHTHQHHWVVYLIKGRMKEKFGGTLEYICEAGDIWAAQAGAEHCTEALADNEIFEFKWPAPMLWEGLIQSWEAH